MRSSRCVRGRVDAGFLPYDSGEHLGVSVSGLLMKVSARQLLKDHARVFKPLGCRSAERGNGVCFRFSSVHSEALILKGFLAATV